MSKEKSITGSVESLEQLYFRDLTRHKLLTIQEERDLINRIQQGDQKALNKLILGNLRFVVSVARQYHGRGLSFLELISEGTVGLYKAAKRFDPTREIKFISYAVWWIRQSIQKALFEQVGAAHIPPYKLNLVRRFQKALVKNMGDYYKTMQQDEFKESEKEIVEIMEKIASASLDSPVGSDNDSRDPVTTLMDVLGEAGDQEASHEKVELHHALDNILGNLSYREEKVLRMYYGVNYSREFTLDEIAHELKLTRERVRQIKNKAIRKLFRSRESKEKLLPFLPEEE